MKHLEHLSYKSNTKRHKEILSDQAILNIANPDLHLYNIIEKSKEVAPFQPLHYKEPLTKQKNMYDLPILIQSSNFPPLSKQPSPLIRITAENKICSYENSRCNIEDIKPGSILASTNPFDQNEQQKWENLGGNLIKTINNLQTTENNVPKAFTTKTKKNNIMRLLDDAILGRRAQNEYILRMANKNYIVLNEELRNSCFILLKDKQSQRYLIKRKKSTFRSSNYDDINLQAKSIQLVKKERPTKSPIKGMKPIKEESRASKIYEEMKAILKRSFSLASQRILGKDKENRRKVIKSLPNEQRNSISHCNTAPEKNNEFRAFKDQPKLRIENRRKSTEGKSEILKRLEDPTMKIIDENVPIKPKKKLRYKKKQYEEKEEPIVLPPKKPPVPRFSFVIRPPKEKDELVKPVEEKPKPKPRPPLILPPDNYLFSIAYGNNSCIVRRIMERRVDWKETPTFNSAFQFKWHPISRFIKFEQLNPLIKQIVNHLECHHEITTKDYLFMNLNSYCELNKLNVFNYVPLTFNLDLDSPAYNNDLEKMVNTFNIIQSACASVKESDNEVQLESARAIINSRLASMTFNKERRLVRSCIPTIMPTHFRGKNIWIIKPTGFNRGRGVEVFTTIEQMKKIIRDSAEGINETEKEKETQSKQEALKSPEPLSLIQPEHEKLPESTAWESTHPPISNLNNLPSIVKTRTFVIQKYIENPLLINKRKFDIRAWVLVTHEMKGYFFKEGYLRMSSFEYNTDVNNREIHLTNNAVQKNTEGYGHLEDGNQLSYTDFQKYIDTEFPNKGVSVKEHLYKKMKEFVNIALLSVRKKLNPDYKKYCFEIFGFDFMVDYDFNVWLIEVNTNPCLEESSQLLKTLLPRMLDDAFKLTVDVIFPKKKKKDEVDASNMKPSLPVTGYANDENMWDYVTQIGFTKTTISSSCKIIKTIEPIENIEAKCREIH